MAWTWLAILATVAIDRVMGAIAEPPSPTAVAASPAGTLALLVSLAILSPIILDVPTRFAAVDESQDHVAADWVDHVLATLQPDAVVISWWSFSTPLWYAQRVEGRRPDLTIVDDRTRLDEGLGEITDVIDANLGKRPVYVIREDPNEVAQLTARYRLEPIAGAAGFDLTRVTARLGAGS
jgi:hypothetical protein